MCRARPPAPIDPLDVAEFFRLLGVTVAAGVPLPRALAIVHESLPPSHLASVACEVRARVADGMPLSDALARHPGVFHRLHVALLAAGEASGGPARALVRLAGCLAQGSSARERVRAALIYPVIVPAIAALVALALLVFVIPQLRAIFDAMNVEHPVVIRAIFGLSQLVIDWWWLLVPAACLFVDGVLRRAASATSASSRRVHLPLRLHDAPWLY